MKHAVKTMEGAIRITALIEGRGHLLRADGQRGRCETPAW
jgi:hypothetical protein